MLFLLKKDLYQKLKAQLEPLFSDLNHKISKQNSDHHIQLMEHLQDTLQKGRSENLQFISQNLSSMREQLQGQMKELNQSLDKQMQHISDRVDQRLNQGFEKTNQTFHDIIKRLALIDQAQEKMTALSHQVVDLNSVLNDKQSRGAFGEVQLSALIDNMIPKKHYALQSTLSNNMRADCIIYLPKPTGNMVIDSKFPLEPYHLIKQAKDESALKEAKRLFKQSIKKHIQDIQSKYILPPETADGAMMFIPSESIFAEIHAHHPELVELSHQKRVWLVSPSTMMAILTTIRAVIKDDATREQVDIIQQHLKALSKDFSRFGVRMDALARHIKQAHEDVDQVHISAKKIHQHFDHIEKVELDTKPQILENITQED